MASPVNDVAVVDTCFGVDAHRTRSDSYPAGVAVEVVLLNVAELVTADHRGPERVSLQTAHRDGFHNIVGMHDDPGQREGQGT